jgi:hypothetical protein
MDGGDARRLVLADFGLAQQLDVEGRATLHRGRGTERYMAPEVLDGSALSVTAAADVYSAGVALRKLPAHAVRAAAGAGDANVRRGGVRAGERGGGASHLATHGSASATDGCGGGRNV